MRLSSARKTQRAALLAAALLMLCSSALAQGTAQAATPAGNADKGKKLYNEYGCYQCHGYEGQGAAATNAARLAPPMMSAAQMLRYIRAPKGTMPPYTEKVLSEQDMADIYAYLQSRPKPPAVKSIQLLND